MTAFQQFQKRMQQQVLAMWPDKLPPQLAGGSREQLERMMELVARFSTANPAELPADMPPVHRFFVDFGQRRYRDFVGLGTMLNKVHAEKSEEEFQAWLEKHVPTENREEARLAMQAAREGR